MTPKVQDQGHRAADKELAKLMKRLQRSYRQASLNLQEKINAYMERFEKEDAAMRALYDSGKLSHEDYMSWRCKKIAGTKQWKRMREQLVTDLVNADKIAAKMIRDALPEIYAENHNYGTYEIERDLQMSTSYTLYNRDAVKRLLREDPDLLPQPSVNVRKDERWNRQHIQSAVLQGILTGESMQKIAGRMQDVAEMDARAAMRNARTAVTGAENAGKLDSMRRAISLGVQLQKLWLATRDSRTRDSHVIMDGEQVDVEEKFSNGCMYPGDPDGAPAEVYNCRCAMRSKVAGADPYSPNLSRNQRLGGMSYEQWKEAHRVFGENPGISRENIGSYSIFKDSLLSNKIVSNPVKKLEKELTSDEIFEKLEGIDKTKGSCMSLSLAYAGNKCGFDVTDFRGGKSQKAFERFSSLESACKAANARIETYEATEELERVKNVLKLLNQDKEYILATGRHATIVRKTEEHGLQYLEMQLPKNGWKSFKTKRSNLDQTLMTRWGCRKHFQGGKVYLIELDSFEPTEEFRDIISYINTAPDKQEKRLIFDMSTRYYKNKKTDKIWWIRDPDICGVWEFTFDKKVIFNMFQDYPEKLTKEQKEIFDKENPFWAENLEGKK